MICLRLDDHGVGGLVRYVILAGVRVPGTGLVKRGRRNLVRLALGLVPFSVISLQASFWGSALLLVASLFGRAAVMAALIESAAAGSLVSMTYYFGRAIGDELA